MRKGTHPWGEGSEYGFPPRDWEGWEAIANDLDLEADCRTFRARQATKLVLKAEGDNLCGQTVDWDDLEAKLTAICMGDVAAAQLGTQAEAVPTRPLILAHERKKRGKRTEYCYIVAITGQTQEEAEFYTKGQLKAEFPDVWVAMLEDWKLRQGAAANGLTTSERADAQEGDTLGSNEGSAGAVAAVQGADSGLAAEAAPLMDNPQASVVMGGELQQPVAPGGGAGVGGSAAAGAGGQDRQEQSPGASLQRPAYATGNAPAPPPPPPPPPVQAAPAPQPFDPVTQLRPMPADAAPLNWGPQWHLNAPKPGPAAPPPPLGVPSPIPAASKPLVHVPCPVEFYVPGQSSLRPTIPSVLLPPPREVVSSAFGYPLPGAPAAAPAKKINPLVAANLAFAQQQQQQHIHVHQQPWPALAPFLMAPSGPVEAKTAAQVPMQPVQVQNPDLAIEQALQAAAPAHKTALPQTAGNRRRRRQAAPPKPPTVPTSTAGEEAEAAQAKAHPPKRKKVTVVRVPLESVEEVIDAKEEEVPAKRRTRSSAGRNRGVPGRVQRSKPQQQSERKRKQQDEKLHATGQGIKEEGGEEEGREEEEGVETGPLADESQRVKEGKPKLVSAKIGKNGDYKEVPLDEGDDTECRLTAELWKGSTILAARRTADGHIVWVDWPDGVRKVLLSSRMIGPDKAHCMEALIKFYESKTKPPKSQR